MKKRIELEKLASELHTDITRASMSLQVRSDVLEPLFKDFGTEFKGFYNHLFTATSMLSFMTLSRIFDKPKGRFSVTLEELVKQVMEAKPNHPKVKEKAGALINEIQDVRDHLAPLRNNIFAHRNYYTQKLPDVRCSDLTDALGKAKEILNWYGSCFGQSFIYLPEVLPACPTTVDLI